MECPNCGLWIVPPRSNCPRCGAALAPAWDASPATQPNPGWPEDTTPHDPTQAPSASVWWSGPSEPYYPGALEAPTSNAPTSNAPDSGWAPTRMQPNPFPAPNAGWPGSSEPFGQPYAFGAPFPQPPEQLQQPQPRRRSRALLFTGLVLAVAIVALAAFGGVAYLLGARSPLHGGPQSVGASTTSTASPTGTLAPTATATTAPTATSLPATATPAPTLVTLMNDPLSSNTNGWYTDGGSFTFQSDGYHIRNGPAISFAPLAALGDANISVEVKCVNNCTNVGGGIVLRDNNTSQFGADGYYREGPESPRLSSGG